MIMNIRRTSKTEAVTHLKKYRGNRLERLGKTMKALSPDSREPR